MTSTTILLINEVAHVIRETQIICFLKKEIGNSMEKGPYQNCRRHVCRFGTCAALLPTATYYYLLLSAKEKGFYHTGNLIYQQNCCRCRFVQVLCTQANDISLTCLLFLVSSCEPFCTYMWRPGRIMTKHNAPNVVQNVTFVMIYFQINGQKSHLSNQSI